MLKLLLQLLSCFYVVYAQTLSGSCRGRCGIRGNGVTYNNNYNFPPPPNYFSPFSPRIPFVPTFPRRYANFPSYGIANSNGFNVHGAYNFAFSPTVTTASIGSSSLTYPMLNSQSMFNLQYDNLLSSESLSYAYNLKNSRQHRYFFQTSPQACSCDRPCFRREDCCTDVSDICQFYYKAPSTLSPTPLIVSVSDELINGVSDAVKGLNSLPSIPYVPNATFAGGHEDVVLSNVQISARMSQISEHSLPLSLVTMYGTTLPAVAFYQSVPALPLQDVHDYRSFLANAEEAALIEQEESLEDNVRRFTDAEYATDVWFYRTAGKGVIAYNPIMVLQKVQSGHSTELNEEFEGQFLVRPQDHYWMDLRYMDDQMPQNRSQTNPSRYPEATNIQYGVGSIVILEMGQDKVLRPVAIRIIMTKEDDSQSKQVFVRGECTESAWIMALLAAACSYTQTSVGISHIYAYHAQAANFQQQFFNNLGPEHRIMEMLKPMTQYTMQFNTAVLENTWAPLHLMPYYNSDLERFSSVLKGWNTMAEKIPYYKLLVSTILSESGIDKSDFTENSDWDKFPLVKFQLACEDAARKFVSKCVSHLYRSDYVNNLYRNDKAVRDDVQLQSFFDAMQDPDRGNVKATADGHMSTVEQLEAFLLPYVYGTIVHGSARMRRYILAGSVIPNDIASFMSTELVDRGPTAEYPMSSILTSLPDTATLAAQYQFTTFFQASDNLNSLLDENSTPPYSSDTLNEIFRQLQADVLEIYNEGYYAENASNPSKWPLNQEAR